MAQQDALDSVISGLADTLLSAMRTTLAGQISPVGQGVEGFMEEVLSQAVDKAKAGLISGTVVATVPPELDNLDYVSESGRCKGCMRSLGGVAASVCGCKFFACVVCMDFWEKSKKGTCEKCAASIDWKKLTWVRVTSQQVDEELERKEAEAEETEKENEEAEDDEETAAFHNRRAALWEKRQEDFKKKKDENLKYRQYYQKDVNDLTECYLKTITKMKPYRNGQLPSINGVKLATMVARDNIDADIIVLMWGTYPKKAEGISTYMQRGVFKHFKDNYNKIEEALSNKKKSRHD